MNELSANETAKLLGVSGATIRNWSRAGYILAANQHPLAFSKDEVMALRERIRTNRFNRLRKRANKSASNEIMEPDVENAAIASDIMGIAKEITEFGFEFPNALYVVALHYLRAEGEVGFSESSNLEPRTMEWRRQAVREVMLDWRRRISGPILSPAGASGIGVFLGLEGREDRLGLLYQGLSSVGRRAQTGAYFTPTEIIETSLSELGDTPRSFLDPCCGTGRYLLRAANRFHLDPANLHGFDSDPVAVDIARLNLLLAYRNMDFVPSIRCLDSLRELANGMADCDTNHLLGNIDAIATNPPWGSCKNQARNKNLVQLIKSGESFSLFLEKSLRLLKEGGLLSFILPEAMLKIKAHTDIRRLLVTETRIRKISLLGRVFAGVFTPIVRLDVEKRVAPPEWKVVVEHKGGSHHCPQRRFAVNGGHAFDVMVKPHDEELLRKIYDVPHQTLRNNAEWALGIVTGDNARLVLDAPAPDAEPVLRGRDIFKFAARPPRCYIRYNPSLFQQVAPERFYRAPQKLVYRFVSDHLVFAYDDRRRLTLNSANILIPRLPKISIKAALAFLNSTVFQYLFVKKHRTRKVLRGDLETLPFPVLSPSSLREIEAQVDLCMSGEYQPAEELDRMVFRAFTLNDEEIGKMEASLAAEAGTTIL